MSNAENYSIFYLIAGDGNSAPAHRNAESDAIRDAIDSARGTSGFVWVHFQGDVNFISSSTQSIGLPGPVTRIISAQETRPRCTVVDEGAVVILRGVNLNEGAEPEDMISIRVWLERGLIVTCAIRQLLGVSDFCEMIETGRAPLSPAQLAGQIALRLADRTEPVVASLNEQVDDLEEMLEDDASRISRATLADIRRTAIILRRYIFPQRDALTTLVIEELGWIDQRAMSQLREAVDRVTRLTEELDALRDRAQVIHDQIMDERSERMNRQMLVLTVVAALFLPISFLTGLFGMNVGGLPLEQNPFGFAIIVAAMAVILILELLIFRWMRLI